jgi:raffinose/stachyose/melibiose transport system permease protein
VLIVIVWKYFGFMMLYIAGMQSIDRHLYEAASIDGANAWQRFRFVTLPGLAPMIRLSVFFSLIGSPRSLTWSRRFDGGPLNTTHTRFPSLFFGITRMRVSFGSAVAVLFILYVAVAFGYKRCYERLNHVARTARDAATAVGRHATPLSTPVGGCRASRPVLRRRYHHRSAARR